jgi:hypothetical protein
MPITNRLLYQLSYVGPGSILNGGGGSVKGEIARRPSIARLAGPGKHAAAKCAEELCSALGGLGSASPREQLFIMAVSTRAARTQTAVTLLTSLSYATSDSAGSSTQSV